MKSPPASEDFLNPNAFALAPATNGQKRKHESDRDRFKTRYQLNQVLRGSKLPDASYKVDTTVQTGKGTTQRDLSLALTLCRIADTPRTSDVVKVLTSNLRLKGLTHACLGLPLVLLDPPPFDVHTPSNNLELEHALKGRFQCIFIGSKTNLAYTHHWTLRKQVYAMGGTEGPACQPSRKLDRDHSTHKISNETLHRCFIDGSPLEEEIGTNILDCHNHSNYQFWPDAVEGADVIRQIIHLRRRGSWTRQPQSIHDSSSTEDLVDPGWMILSCGPTLSPFHADAAGYCTVTVGLEGRKIWHSPKGAWETNRCRFFDNGPYGTHYPSGLYKLGIGERDCLITPPGYIHAVYTPEGCAMLAGHFIYTAGHFATSIDCVRLQYMNRIHTNDDIKQEDFRRLAFVVNNLDLPDLFSADQLEAIYCSIQRLLEHIGIVKRRASGWHRTWIDESCTKSFRHRLYTQRFAGRASGPAVDTAEVEEKHFLWSCVEFYWHRRTLAGE